jgi:electron transport complex protein RnfC
MEQAEKDKEAKRAARREAAEKAKATVAANSGTEKEGTGPVPGSAADIIAAAQARAAAKQVSPEEQQAKFERSIAGAEMRVQMAEEKLATASDSSTDEQKNILNAAIEGAKQKLEQAKARLAEHVEQQNGEQVD